MWNRNVPSLSLLYRQSNICTCFPSLTHNSHWSTEVLRVTSFCNPLGFHPVVAVTNYSSSVTSLSLSIYIYIFFFSSVHTLSAVANLGIPSRHDRFLGRSLPSTNTCNLACLRADRSKFSGYISINVGALIKPEFEMERQGNPSICSRTSAILNDCHIKKQIIEVPMLGAFLIINHRNSLVSNYSLCFKFIFLFP